MNKVPFIAAVQTGDDGRPLFACFAKQPFTPIRWRSGQPGRWPLPPTLSPTDCGAGGVKIIGAEHTSTVTDDGKASSKLPQFKTVNTPLLGDLKTALSGT